MELPDVLPWIAALAGGGGLAAAIGVLIKIRPEAGQITVVSAEKALIVQTGVLDSVNKELARLGARFAALEAEQAGLYARIASLEADKQRLEDVAEKLRDENAVLTARVLDLERR